MDGNGINDLVFEAYDCSVLSDPENNPYAGPQYVDVLTRKSDGTYNPEQTIDNITYLNVYGPAVINADGNGKPDIVAMQCSDDRCSTPDTIITLLNTTEGTFSTCAAPGSAAGIHVCSPVTPPGNGAPAICKPSGDGCSFETAAAGPGIMRSTQLWVDGKQRVEQLSGFSNYTFLNQNLQLTPGIHDVRIVADGWDGSLQEKSFRLVMAGR
jgi:hypothetical protein